MHILSVMGKLYPIVNDVEKSWIQVRDLPILLVMNYAILLDDTDETEPLYLPFEMTKHGATVDMTTKNLGGDGGLYVNAEYLPFWWDNEKLYYNIEKPTEEYLEDLERFELNSSTSNYIQENHLHIEQGRSFS